MDEQTVDDLLTEAGRRWRDTLPSAPDIDPLVGEIERQRQSLLPLLASLTATVLVVAAVLGSGALRPSPSGTLSTPLLDWTANDYAAAIVDPGDRVAATGYVIRYPGEPTVICLPGAVAGVGSEEPRPPFACGEFRARLDGLDLNGLPGRTEASGAVYSPSRLAVLGTWTGTSIIVSSVDVAPQPPALSEGIPCPEPPQGWPSFPPGTLPGELEAAARPLADEVANHPELYSTIWAPDSGGSEPTRAVQVVGTVGDPETLRPRLEKLYPYGVCPVKVRYSAADLQRTYGKLANVPGISMDVDAQLDRLRVEMTMVTHQLAGILSVYPEVTPQPLILSTS